MYNKLIQETFSQHLPYLRHFTGAVGVKKHTIYFLHSSNQESSSLLLYYFYYYSSHVLSNCLQHSANFFPYIVSFKNLHSPVKEVGPSPFKSQGPRRLSDLLLSPREELRTHPASKPLITAPLTHSVLQLRLHGRAGEPHSTKGQTCH